MAFPTAVNSQITDSVTEVTQDGNPDTAALADHYTALARSVNELHQQATLAQHYLTILHTALTGAGVPLDPPAPPMTVAPQITDAISQGNVKVPGDASTMAMGNLFVATSQALSNAAHNAVNAQQQSYVTMQAATTMGITTLYSLDTASTGVATSEIFE